MKIKDILYAIEQGVQNLGSFIYLDFTSKEVLLQFNTIAVYYSRRHFDMVLPPEFKRLFEGTRINTDDLRLLKKLDVVLEANNDRWKLPTDYEHKIRLEAKGIYCKAAVVSDIREYSSHIMNNIKSSPLTKTHQRSLLFEIEQAQIKVYIPEKYTLNSVILSYVRKVKQFTEIQLEEEYTEYPEDVIFVLVDLTVKRLLEITQSPRYQTKTIENNL